MFARAAAEGAALRARPPAHPRASHSAFGSWRPSHDVVHSLRSISWRKLSLAANLELGVDRAYSPSFVERVKRDLKPETPLCVDHASIPVHPNVLFVLVESLSMHHSQLFGGARDLTPQPRRDRPSIHLHSGFLREWFHHRWRTDRADYRPASCSRRRPLREHGGVQGIRRFVARIAASCCTAPATREFP